MLVFNFLFDSLGCLFEANGHAYSEVGTLRSIVAGGAASKKIVKNTTKATATATATKNIAEEIKRVDSTS
jgi:hypothetical protein